MPAALVPLAARRRMRAAKGRIAEIMDAAVSVRGNSIPRDRRAPRG